MINLIKKIKKCTIMTLALVVIAFPIVAEAAEDTNDLKNQFMSLGGTENGYKTILQMVEKSRISSDTLSNAIKEKYNQKLFEAMVTNSFDEKFYSQVYSDMRKEKNNLLNKNLADMVSLLKSLSLEDRKAYAQLLYGIDRVIPNAIQTTDANQNTDEDVSKNAKNDAALDNEKNNNLDTGTGNSSTTDDNVAGIESKVENNVSNATNKSSIGNPYLLNKTNN